MGELGIGPDDIAKLEPEVAYITSNAEIEAIALVSDTGYQVAYAAVPGYDVDSDSLCGISSALSMTAKMAIQTMFNENLSEVIIRAGNGYMITTSAGRFVIVGAGTNIPKLMKNVKVFRIAAKRIGTAFPGV